MVAITYKYELSLSVPLYNEQECVENDIGGILREFDSRKINYELVLVNNGSIDRTGQLIDDIKKKNKRVKVIHLKKNAGFGGGIIAGLNKAEGMYVGFTCSDGQISPADTLKILEKLKTENLDLCKARRVVRHDGFIRYVLSKLYNSLISLLFFVRIKDINGYPLIMQQKVYKNLNIKSKNWMINVEILSKALKDKYKVGDVPVTFRARTRGKSHVKIGTPINFLIQLLRFRFSRK